VVTSLREGGDELLTFFRFPKAQWKTLRTTNTIATGPALQPRGERADQVAQDRRLAEDRCGAQPAHGGGSVTVVRAALTVVLALTLLAAPLAAGAQPAGKVYRVGILRDKASDSSETHLWQTFLAALRERGLNEGVNLQIEYRGIEGNAARLPEVAADLVRLKPDLIATRGSFFTGALKAATSSIPIVFVGHADPVGTGHVASLARPGGNITGMAVLQTELGPKGLELLHAVVPAATRVAVLWHPGTPSAVPGLKALEEPARLLALQVQPVGARTAGELEGAFATMARGGAQALVVFSTAPFITARQRLAELAIAHRLPTMFQGGLFVEAGGLMSYYPNHEDVWRRAAVYVDKILKGAKPADLPVEQASKFEFVINNRTAKAIGLTIPQSVLQRADHIIE
jgi:putative tryptophan/tyrosine transport system substrate-binding protein